MRLVTFCNLDVLTAAILISEMEQVDEILRVYLEEIIDTKIEITSNNILANPP